MKSIVPQEQQQEIVKLYVEDKKSINYLAQQYNYNWDTIKHVLLLNDISIRSKKEQMKYSQSVKPAILQETPELQLKIIELYREGYGLQKIPQLLNLQYSAEAIKSFLIYNNINIRDNLAAKISAAALRDDRKYQINDNYNFNSHNGAWMIGFYAADGYIPQGKGRNTRVTLTVQRQDEEILYQIKNELCYTGPIYQFIANDKKLLQSSLSFTSKIIRQELANYGIVNCKTTTFKHIPDRLNDLFIPDFIRGYIDGDGYVTQGNNRLSIGIGSVNKDLLEDITNYIYLNYNIDLPTICCDQRHNLPYYYFSYGRINSLKLSYYLYNNNFLSLQRKRQKILDFQKHYFLKNITPTSLNIPQE